MRLLSGHTPIIFGDGSQTRDFVYVEDVARANVLAMGKDLEGIYNIGTGVETSVSTLASILIRMTGFQGTVEHRPPREGEQQRSVIDPLLAAKELGWKSTLGLEQGLEKTVQYFRKFLGQKQAQD
jgi:UDP-glucose 4-epimerase